jgi:hypothetical protein
MESIMEVLKKLKIELSYHPVIPVLGIYPKKCAAGYDRASRTSIFIAALLTISKF